MCHLFLNIYSRLLRWSTARGSISRLSPEGPLRLRLVSLFYLLKVPLKLKIKSTCLILLSHVILSHFAQMWYAVAKCNSQLFSFSESCDQNGDMGTKNDESYLICIRWLKSSFIELWKIWDSVYISGGNTSIKKAKQVHHKMGLLSDNKKLCVSKIKAKNAFKL